MGPFRFLSNHGMALLTIAHDPNARMRDIDLGSLLSVLVPPGATGERRELIEPTA